MKSPYQERSSHLSVWQSCTVHTVMVVLAMRTLQRVVSETLSHSSEQPAPPDVSVDLDGEAVANEQTRAVSG